MCHVSVLNSMESGYLHSRMVSSSVSCLLVYSYMAQLGSTVLVLSVASSVKISRLWIIFLFAI